MRASLNFLALLLLSAPAAGGRDVIYAWADVSITDTGIPSEVKLVEPPLSPEMAAPIENVVRAWRFSRAVESGSPVARTTSVFLSIRFVVDASGGGRIEAEKLDEGPRIVRGSRDPCLESLSGEGPTLTFRVNEEGRAVEISSPTPESESDQCAIKVIRDTVFKPDTVNGRTVSTRISRRVRFK
jgi:TonB family protein